MSATDPSTWEVIDLSVSQTLSLAEAAVPLGISTAGAYKMAREGRFPIRVLEIGGRTKRVSRVELERYLAGVDEEAS